MLSEKRAQYLTSGLKSLLLALFTAPPVAGWVFDSVFSAHGVTGQVNGVELGCFVPQVAAAPLDVGRDVCKLVKFCYAGWQSCHVSSCFLLYGFCPPQIIAGYGEACSDEIRDYRIAWIGFDDIAV